VEAHKSLRASVYRIYLCGYRATSVPRGASVAAPLVRSYPWNSRGAHRMAV